MSKEKHLQLREIIKSMERKLGVLSESGMACCGGVSLAQCHALVQIGRTGKTSLIELSRILELDNSTLSRTINSLCEKGLAERVADPQDRRYIRISLTDEGARLYALIEKNMNSFYKNIFDAIPEDKQEQVIKSLQILLKAMGDGCCNSDT